MVMSCVTFQALRLRREENIKRRKENERKAEIVQPVSSCGQFCSIIVLHVLVVSHSVHCVSFNNNNSTNLINMIVFLERLSV